MSRVKRGVTSHARHRKVLKAAKGYYGRRKNTIRIASQAVEKAGQYAYRDRKVRKRTFRALWIQRINAAARLNGITYGRFIDGLNKAGISSTARCLPISRCTSRRPSRAWSRPPRRRQRLKRSLEASCRPWAGRHAVTRACQTMPPVSLKRPKRPPSTRSKPSCLAPSPRRRRPRRVWKRSACRRLGRRAAFRS